MAWTAHKIILQLCSPMHVGAAKVGNLQRTRRYVTGRVLWGAFTARLTRDGHPKGRPQADEYVKMGDRVQRELAFSYLYPTTEDRAGKVDLWPWDDGFDYRFLSSYASTALNPRHGSAEEASLHEIECVRPYTRGGDPVYLAGYLFQREGSHLDWRAVLDRLQLGGERGYGWGVVKAVSCQKVDRERRRALCCDLSSLRPILTFPKGQRLPAHALAADSREKDGSLGSEDIDGTIEPLVGWSTRTHDHSEVRICYAPGALTKVRLDLQIGFHGILKRARSLAGQN